MKKGLQRAILVWLLFLLLLPIVLLPDVSAEAHEMLALLFLAVLLLHLLVNRKALFCTPAPLRAADAELTDGDRRARRILHLCAGAVLLVTAVSGLLQSKLLPGLNAGGTFFPALHGAASRVLLVLVTAHAATHFSFLLQVGRNFLVRRRLRAILVTAGCVLVTAAVFLLMALSRPSASQKRPSAPQATPLFGAADPTPMPDQLPPLFSSEG